MDNGNSDFNGLPGDNGTKYGKVEQYEKGSELLEQLGNSWLGWLWLN